MTVTSHLDLDNCSNSKNINTRVPRFGVVNRHLTSLTSKEALLSTPETGAFFFVHARINISIACKSSLRVARDSGQASSRGAPLYGETGTFGSSPRRSDWIFNYSRFRILLAKKSASCMIT